jgi:hypothetical protein
LDSGPRAAPITIGGGSASNPAFGAGLNFR